MMKTWMKDLLIHLLGVSVLGLCSLITYYQFISMSGRYYWLKAVGFIAAIYAVTFIFSLICKVHSREYRFTRIFKIISLSIAVPAYLNFLIVLLTFNLGSIPLYEHLVILYSLILIGFFFYFLFKAMATRADSMAKIKWTVAIILIVLGIGGEAFYFIFRDYGSLYSLKGTISYPYFSWRSPESSVDRLVKDIDISAKVVDSYRDKKADEIKELEQTRLVGIAKKPTNFLLNQD
jgi:hypothetical protein